MTRFTRSTRFPLLAGLLAAAMAAPLTAQQRMSDADRAMLLQSLDTPENTLPGACDLPRVARPARLPFREVVPYDESGETCGTRDAVEWVPVRTTYRIDLPKRTSLELQVSSTDFGPGVSLHDTAGRVVWTEREGDPFHGPVVRKDSRTLRASLPAGTWFAIVRDDFRVSALQDKRRKQVTVEWREAAGPLPADALVLCATPSYDPLSVIGPDGRLTGTLDDSDCQDRDFYFRRRDVHEIRVPSGRTLVVRATGTGYTPKVALYDLNDSLRTPRLQRDSDQEGVRYGLAAGRYFLVVRPELRDDDVTKQGAYEVTVATEGAASPDSSTYGAICQRPQFLRVPQRAGAVLTRESCRGADGAPQHDYVLDVPAAQQVRIRARRESGWSVPVLRVLAADGTELATARAAASDPTEASLTQRLEAGRYLLRVAAQPGGIGTVVTSVEGEAKLCNLPADVSAPLAAGRLLTGAITSSTCLLRGNPVPVAVHPLVVTQAEELRVSLDAQGFAAALTVQRVGGQSEPAKPGDTRTARTIVVQPGTYYVGVVSADRLPGTYRLCVARPGASCGP